MGGIGESWSPQAVVDEGEGEDVADGCVWLGVGDK